MNVIELKSSRKGREEQGETATEDAERIGLEKEEEVKRKLKPDTCRAEVYGNICHLETRKEGLFAITVGEK